MRIEEREAVRRAVGLLFLACGVCALWGWAWTLIVIGALVLEPWRRRIA